MLGVEQSDVPPEDARDTGDALDLTGLAIPPEPYRAGRLDPEMDGESLEELWRTENYCPGVLDEADRKTGTDIAYTELEHNGQRQAIIIAALQSAVDSVVPETVGVAIIDARTGDTLNCITFRETGLPGFISHTLPVSGASKRAFMHVLAKQGGEFAASQFSSLTVDLHEQSANTSVLSELNVPPRKSRIAVSGYGQVVSSVSNWGLVSTDSETGKLLWQLRPGNLEPPLSQAVLGTPFVPFGRNVHVFAQKDGELNWLRLDKEGRVVDRQKVPHEPFYGEMDLTPPMFIDGKIALTERERGHTVVFEDRNWSVLHREKHCVKTVSVSTTMLACLKTSDSEEGRGKIVVFQADGRKRHVIDLLPGGLPDNAQMITAPKSWLVAADENRLLTYSSIVSSVGADGFPTATNHVTIVTHGGEPSSHSTLTFQSNGQASTGLIGPPLLSPDGILFLNAFGQIYAFQTTLNGLAKTQYPRGSQLGGNENRGFVRVP
jgi:hypothetical protein